MRRHRGNYQKDTMPSPHGPITTSTSTTFATITTTTAWPLRHPRARVRLYLCVCRYTWFNYETRVRRTTIFTFLRHHHRLLTSSGRPSSGSGSKLLRFFESCPTPGLGFVQYTSDFAGGGFPGMATSGHSEAHHAAHVL